MASTHLFGLLTAGLRLASGAIAISGFGMSALGTASAQDYPQKLVRMIVPGGAGGPGDILARVAAQRLQVALGQNVVVENIPGAGGMIAARTVARAAPDGHTLLFGNTTTLAILPAISKSPGYDPHADFVAVAKIADTFQVLVVEPTSPMKSVHALIDGPRPTQASSMSGQSTPPCHISRRNFSNPGPESTLSVSRTRQSLKL
jgi:tripartite-type tricarboxylate transporter receptor subunit TctC